MAENVKISDAVTIKSDSKYRVVLELMQQIDYHSDASDADKANREYWFKLYHQSLRIVNGVDPEKVLKN